MFNPFRIRVSGSIRVLLRHGFRPAVARPVSVLSERIGGLLRARRFTSKVVETMPVGNCMDVTH